MVVRVWPGDVDRSADDFARVEERADRDRSGEAVEEIPPAEVFDRQRRFAFRQNRVSHAVTLSMSSRLIRGTWLPEDRQNHLSGLRIGSDSRRSMSRRRDLNPRPL